MGPGLRLVSLPTGGPRSLAPHPTPPCTPPHLAPQEAESTCFLDISLPSHQLLLEYPPPPLSDEQTQGALQVGAVFLFILVSQLLAPFLVHRVGLMYVWEFEKSPRELFYLSVTLFPPVSLPQISRSCFE